MSGSATIIITSYAAQQRHAKWEQEQQKFREEKGYASPLPFTTPKATIEVRPSASQYKERLKDINNKFMAECFCIVAIHMLVVTLIVYPPWKRSKKNLSEKNVA